MRPTTLLLPAILLLTTACSTAQPSPPPSPTPAPTPVASEAPPPSAGPTTPPAAPVPTPSPADTPVPSMTPEEEALMGALRIDAAVDCAPRRADLPEGSVRGIECRPEDPAVARVGIYWFAAPNDAAHAYMTRMASYGVDVSAGDCNRDIPGDSAWIPGDHEGSVDDPGVFNWENAVLAPDRIGCFGDENGNANVRVTCGNAYIGVLGTGGRPLGPPRLGLALSRGI